jgi:predicted flap endonuclease-1-like 5' DNA nuclease
MLYLIAQMLACLLFTAALALIAGWLLRGIGARAQLEVMARERDEHRRRITALEERLASTPPPPSNAVPAGPTVVQMRRESDAQALTVLRDRLGQLDSVARLQAERMADLGQQLREKDQLLENLKQQLEHDRAKNPSQVRPQAGAPTGLLTEPPHETDRLQAISGIGPVIERVLNELGIYRFGQLARLTPDNIEWLASRIGWFPQRIQRDDWIGQARRLQRDVHPDDLQ